MAKIQFKAKIQKMYTAESAVAYEYVKVPEFGRQHCDMQAFRTHKKFGAYANSDLFAGMLESIRRKVFSGRYLRLDALPEGVLIDTSGFLAVVTLDV